MGADFFPNCISLHDGSYVLKLYTFDHLTIATTHRIEYVPVTTCSLERAASFSCTPDDAIASLTLGQDMVVRIAEGVKTNSLVDRVRSDAVRFLKPREDNLGQVGVWERSLKSESFSNSDHVGNWTLVCVWFATVATLSGAWCL